MNRTALDIKLSGTTAVVVFVRGDDLYTANVGDSRAILATQTAKGLRPVELTFDQKPELVAERTRIEAAGGIVEPIIDPFAGPVGPCRVWARRQALPGLSMSRSIGDLLAGSVGVCPDPVVNSFKVGTRHALSRHTALSARVAILHRSLGAYCIQLKPAQTLRGGCGLFYDQFEAGADKFMIVASDGVWEFIDNQEAISIVAQFDDPQQVCTV